MAAARIVSIPTAPNFQNLNKIKANKFSGKMIKNLTITASVISIDIGGF
ncbi:hypothetical protein [Photobacterium sanctipauli]|nr:hypothetical protein [Photobacterium sanctipauli]